MIQLHGTIHRILACEFSSLFSINNNSRKASSIFIVRAQDISVEFEVSCSSYSSAPLVKIINSSKSDRVKEYPMHQITSFYLFLRF